MRRLDTLVILIALTALVGLGAGMAASAPRRPTPFPSLAPIPTPGPPRELVEGTIGPLGTLDPLYAATPAERSIAGLLFRGLIRLGPDGSAGPDLAASWTAEEDGSAYTFVLRPDARWHDGRLVTADDVVATWTTLTEPGYDGPAAGRWTGVAVERIDRFTVRFSLPVPLAGFLSAMTQPLVPAHLLADVPVAERRGHPFGTQPVGNGPFELVTIGADEVLLARWGPPLGGVAATFAPDPLAGAPEPTASRAGPPRPWLDRYRFHIHVDPASLADAFERGSVDIATGLSPDDVERLSRRSDVSVLRYPTARVAALIPNLRFGSGTLRDPAVRRGLSSAIDRERLISEVYGGSATGVRTPVTPTAAVFDEQISRQPFHDPEGARSSFRAAGWTESPDGWRVPGDIEPVRLELLVRDASVDPLGPEAAALVADDWRAIGLAVEVVALPPAELVEDRLRPGEFDLVLLDLEIGLEPDLHALLVSGQAVVGGTNIGGYQSSLVDRLLDEARLAADPDIRVQRFRDLQATLAREMPIIPLAFPDAVTLVHGVLDGVTPQAIAGTGDRYRDVVAWMFASEPDE